MMTTTEILNEISRLSISQQKKLKKKLLADSESNNSKNHALLQDEFDRLLFSNGFLANFPNELDDEETDFPPVKITGKPISETIIEERR